MARDSAIAGRRATGTQRGAASVACLAFVGFLAAAFWAGAVFIGQLLISLFALG